MKEYKLLRLIFPKVLFDYFDLVDYQLTPTRYDIYMDEKKVLNQDDVSKKIHSKGFTEYTVIQDSPIQNKAVYFHLRKRKWLDLETNEAFSYDIDVSTEGTRPTKEFIAFLKG